MQAADIVWNSIFTANKVISILFMAFYAYQILFVIVPVFIRKPKHYKKPVRKYGVLISARNESKVIKNLIESLNSQTYGKENITVFVVADNCDDNTADIAKEAGAVVSNTLK